MRTGPFHSWTWAASLSALLSIFPHPVISDGSGSTANNASSSSSPLATTTTGAGGGSGQNATEMSFLFPRPGETYRLSDTGLAPIIAVQNEQPAPPGWGDRWFVYWRVEGVNEPVGAPHRWQNNYIGKWAGTTTPKGYEILWSSADNTSLIILGRPSYPGLLPAGEYRFWWQRIWYSGCVGSDPEGVYGGTGAGCGSMGNGWPGHESGGPVEQFNITIAASSPSVSSVPVAAFPTLTSACGATVAQISFQAAPVTTEGPDCARYNPTISPYCFKTLPVTNEPAPCKVTVDAAVAARVSAIMTWTPTPTATSLGSVVDPSSRTSWLGVIVIGLGSRLLF
ncbi:hypothetical protein B0H63DRAFT_473503 [Podospora didyma]|uniref:DUF7136 domain-containing protein n=1 Tax=Podospora didyma TaxID=330526 RepID=A0AAE0NQK9_9PEZI|nr:hypothetical protein B0H63DRAFT_473503 [Podospora didyma]